MPKVVLTSNARKNTEQRSLIAYHMEREGKRNDDLATDLHQSRTTLWSRLSDPSTFRLSELRKLFQVLHFSQDEIIQTL